MASIASSSLPPKTLNDNENNSNKEIASEDIEIKPPYYDEAQKKVVIYRGCRVLDQDVMVYLQAKIVQKSHLKN